jgi:hypothetical protein
MLRRDLLSLWFAPIIPALSGSSVPAPAPARSEGAEIRVKCPCYTEAGNGYDRLDVEVLFISHERWETINAAKNSRWDGQLLDDGRVVALRITCKEDPERGFQSHFEPQAWEVAQLRKLRNQVLDFFEGQDDVGSPQLEAGGNCECVFRILKESDRSKYERGFPDNFNIRLDMHDMMSDD